MHLLGTDEKGQNYEVAVQGSCGLSLSTFEVEYSNSLNNEGERERQGVLQHTNQVLWGTFLQVLLQLITFHWFFDKKIQTSAE